MEAAGNTVPENFVIGPYVEVHAFRVKPTKDTLHVFTSDHLAGPPLQTDAILNAT